MKTANTFYWSFVDTLIFNVATISAIVVGIVQFAVRSFNENNGKQKSRQFVIQTLHFVNTLTGKIYASLDHELAPIADPVPVVKVARRRTKRA